MSEEKEESLPQEVEDWLGQPFTQLTLQRVRGEFKEFILGGLLQAARRSSDPEVTKWFARLEALGALESLLETGEYKQK